MSRSLRFLLAVFGPVAVLVVLLAGVPLFFGSHPELQESTVERMGLSRVVDQSRRRAQLPILRRLRILGAPDDFQGLLRYADVIGDRVIVIADTRVIPVDLRTGAVGPAVADLGAAIGRVRSVTTTPRAEIWINGSDGFVRFDPGAPAAPARRILLDAEARDPMWFGDRIVSRGNATVLRLYDVHESTATLIREFGEPLYPGLGLGLSVYLNRVSKTVHPDQDRLAVAFQSSARLHVHDRSGALIRAVAGPVEIDLDFDLVPAAPEIGGYRFSLNNETSFSYLDVDSDRNLIAALFGGRRNGDGADPFLGDELHVFRWDGTPAGVWRLPDPVNQIGLDAANRRIYGVRERPFPSIVELDAGPLYR